MYYVGSVFAAIGLEFVLTNISEVILVLAHVLREEDGSYLLIV